MRCRPVVWMLVMYISLALVSLATVASSELGN